MCHQRNNDDFGGPLVLFQFLRLHGRPSLETYFKLRVEMIRFLI